MQIKTVNDYYEVIYAKFPEVPKLDIKRILNFGWKSLYLHNSYGGDTLISDSEFWSYIGTLRKDSLRHFYYYIKKLALKLRVLYKRNKIQWDGYYYFGLTEYQYLNYLSQKHSRGRPKKKFNYGNVMLYKILDECKVREHNRKYIFKVPYISDLGFSFYKLNYISDKAELIITRDIQKFKDILVTNNKYEYL